MSQTWVLVADGSRARFFNRTKNRKLEELEVLVAPEGRLHEGDLVSDRGGHVDSTGGRGHDVGTDKSAKEHEAVTFAKRIAARVEEGRVASMLDRLVLIAPPKFLGHLRSSLSAPAAGLVALTIDKELTQLTPDKLAEHLPELFLTVKRQPDVEYQSLRMSR